MSQIDQELWSDTEMKPKWADDGQAPVIKRSEPPGPWEVVDEIYAPKVKIEIPTPQEPLRDDPPERFADIFKPLAVHPKERFPDVFPPHSKESNPKAAFGMKKLQLNVVPGSFQAYTSLALLEGALKYGRYNWRVEGARVSIYLDALKRHIEKYEEGQWEDPKSRVPHLANAAACLCIILDAGLAGVLTDDRPPSLPNHDTWIDDLSGIVTHLQKTFEDHTPKQYTIADTIPVNRALNSEETCPKE